MIEKETQHTHMFVLLINKLSGEISYKWMHQYKRLKEHDFIGLDAEDLCQSDRFKVTVGFGIMYYKLKTSLFDRLIRNCWSTIHAESEGLSVPKHMSIQQRIWVWKLNEFVHQ